MTAEHWTEMIKFFGVLAVALAAILGSVKTYGDIQKAKSSIDPQLSQSMVSNIERDSHARRENMELLTKVLVRLSENSMQMNDNHQAGQHKTEELHAHTRKEIAGLSDKIGHDLKTIQSNQESLIQLVGPISDKFRSAA